MQKTNEIAKKKLYLASLGCVKNLVDSEVMLGKLKDFELTDDEEDADLIIVNTCAFIDSAKQESINTVLDLDSSRKENSTLIMAGCLSQRYKDELEKELKEVDIFTGVSDYHRIDELIKNNESRYSSDRFLASYEDKRVVSSSQKHVFIKLSEGCNQTCSFCAIPSFKNGLKSKSLDSIKKELELFIKQGFNEFTFLSNESSSYLSDFGITNGLEKLIDEVEKIKGIKKARIFHLHPSSTDFDLIQKIIDSKVFVNYFDIPIQHISEKMLKIMNRDDDVKRLKKLLEFMKNSPNSFLKTNVIVGHPGESKEDFQELSLFLEEFSFNRVNIYSYSDEDGTLSTTRVDKIDQEIVDKRAEILADIVYETTIKSLESNIGKAFEVFIDKESSEHEYLLSARRVEWAEDIDGEIYINDNEDEIEIIFGELYLVEATQIAGDKLLAKVLKKL